MIGVTDADGRPVDASALRNNPTNGIPPGINIPGIGVVGAAPAQQRQQPRQQGQQPRQQGMAPPPSAPGQPPQQQPQQYQQPMAPAPSAPDYQQQSTSIQIAAPQSSSGARAYPPTELFIMGDAYHAFIDLPGVPRDGISVKLQANALVISGSRRMGVDVVRGDKKAGRSKSHSDYNCTIPKFLQQPFTFTYPFKKSIDESKISASFDDGVLHVTLPHRPDGDGVVVPII
jgi:HSP20 family molecular chaperone IbpA